MCCLAGFSDRVGRKPVMLAGMLLALALYFPGFHLIAQAANPALAAAQRAKPVVVLTDPATCTTQFDPIGTANSTAPATSPRAYSWRAESAHRTAASVDGANT